MTDLPPASAPAFRVPAFRVVDADATRQALPFDALIPALRDAFAEGCEVPLRHHHFIPQGDDPAATLLLMPAWGGQGFLGVKVVTVYPANDARGQPALHSSYLLCDGRTGRHLALLDGNVITARRTVAASALAASFLARRDASSLLVVGSGRVASLTALAYREVLPIRKVAVWDRRPADAARLAADLDRLGFEATPAADLESAARTADIVSCATLSTRPLVLGGWMKPGSHLDLIGAFTPDMRECDAAAVARASVFVDTPDALREAGDLLQAQAEGAFDPGRLQGTLQDLCRGTVPGRRSAEEITLFKSVGTGLEDLAAAVLVHRRTHP